MDIGALLAEADEETYESDRDNTEISAAIPATNDAQHSSQKGTNLLKLAAQEVAQEDQIQAEKVFETASESFKSHKLPPSKQESAAIQNDVDALFESHNDTVKEIKKREEQLVLSEDAEEDYNDDVEYETNETVRDEDYPIRQQDNVSDVDEGEDDNDDDEGVEDPSLNSQLFIACYRSSYDAAKAALKSGARVFGRDRHGWTPLHWAASKGAVDIMELLIDDRKHSGKKVKKYLNARDTITGWTALHLACINGHLDAVQLLLDHKADKNLLNFMQEKPIECIGKSNSSKRIRLLLV